jgi:hypothetical protein
MTDAVRGGATVDVVKCVDVDGNVRSVRDVVASRTVVQIRSRRRGHSTKIVAMAPRADDKPENDNQGHHVHHMALAVWSFSFEKH